MRGFSFFTRKSGSAEAAFWEWFAKNEASLFEFERDQERVFAGLSRAMARVHPSLTFAFGPAEEDGTREFVISADGIREAFPAVEALAAAAPALPRWRWIRFRPRQGPIDLRVGGRAFGRDDVRYVLIEDSRPGRVGVLLLMDGYSEEDERTFLQAGFLMLDAMLGEYDVETRVGAIELDSFHSGHMDASRPLAELPGEIDAYFAQREGRWDA